MKRFSALLFGCLLALSSIAFVVWDAWAWDSAAKTVDSGFRRLGTIATEGRPGGVFVDPDSYYWLSYAKRISAGETWRIRHTFADNTPYGRPVYWSQSISWLALIAGKVWQLATGENWVPSLEKASVWINPFLLILLNCGIGWALFQRIGPVPAGLFMVYLVSLGDVGWTFQPLRLGHQSLYCAFGMLTLAGLVFGGAGWIRASGSRESSPRGRLVFRTLEVPEFRVARFWFLISGACMGLGFWVSAIVSTMLLGLLFGAGLLLAFCAPRLAESGQVRVKPELWRWWGWIAAVVSLLFYFVEYFPNHLAFFRLEVNGPLYSLAVLATGEALCQFLHARYAESNHGTAPLIKGVACAVVAGLIPVAIFAGPETWHALRDPQMFRLHNFIQEFYSLPRFAGPDLVGRFVRNFGIVPIFLALAVGLAAFSNLRLAEWAVMWLSFAVALGLLGFGYFQVRWLGLFAAMNAWLAVIAGTCAWRLIHDRLPQRLQPIIAIFLIALLLIQPVAFASRSISELDDIIHKRSVPKELVRAVSNKRLALAFRAAEGPGARVMADLDIAPALHYFGEASTVASYYWENLAGLHAATKFFADSGDGESARRLAVERGLTHVAVQEGNRWQNYFYFIATGRIDSEAATKVFAARLVGNELTLPDWLETGPASQVVGHQVYTYGGIQLEENWRIYRILQDPNLGH